MIKTIIHIIALFLIFSCESNTYEDLKKPENTELNSLNLKWNKAYSDDSVDKSLIGLKWCLSYVGAKLPKNETGISVKNNIIILDITKIGLSENAIAKALKLNTKIKNSQEYLTTNTIDLGRYIALLIGASEHYYEIIGTPKTLNELLSSYVLKPEKGYINNSSVSLEHRIIRFSEQNGFNQVFLSEEVDPITQEIYEYETIELLPNGQLRFGIFDSNGNRKHNADASHSNAGKPAKCAWCHESNINPLFSTQNDFTGFLTANQLQNTLIGYRNSHHNLKNSLTDGVDFTKTQQHTLTELLYISFMEPSAERLALEWNLPLSQVQTILANLPTHIYTEFPFLGNLYFRKDIENLAPFKGLPVSSNIREQSALEVNYMN